MFILNWSGTHGIAAASGQPWALRVKPDVGIEFEALSYSMGGGSKVVGSQTIPLASDDVLRIEQWITAQNPHQTTDDYVHGADAAGQYLGLVPKEQAAFVLLGPPPNGEGWRWDGVKGAWIHHPALNEAKASAILFLMECAREQRALASGSTDPALLAFRIQKLLLAQAVVGGTATPEQELVIKTEAVMRERGESALDLANKIIASASISASANALFDGLLSLAKRAIDSASSLEEVNLKQAQFTDQLRAIAANNVL